MARTMKIFISAGHEKRREYCGVQDVMEDGTMKRIALAIAALAAFAGLSGQAVAADMGRPLPYKAPPIPYVAPYYNWSGFYVGINGGGGWGTSRWDGGLGSFDTSGGMIGGTAGFNWQASQMLVVGAETDFDWANIRGSGTCVGPFICSTRANWLGTTRGRVGLAFDRVMPYVTGGVAYGNVKAWDGLISESATKAGWTVGGGVEFAFLGNWSAKAEYLYVDLGSFNCATCLGGSPNVSWKSHLVRGGINYRF
jgi:outer membrane immunogenic protein